jgi:hypothetical protein
MGSDTIYWQVADQPGKGGPKIFFKDDSEDEEEKQVCCHLRIQPEVKINKYSNSTDLE